MHSYNQSYKELFVRGNQSEERWLKVHHKIGNIVNYDSCKSSLVEYRIKQVKMSVESKLNGKFVEAVSRDVPVRSP